MSANEDKSSQDVNINVDRDSNLRIGEDFVGSGKLEVNLDVKENAGNTTNEERLWIQINDLQKKIEINASRFEEYRINCEKKQAELLAKIEALQWVLQLNRLTEKVTYNMRKFAWVFVLLIFGLFVLVPFFMERSSPNDASAVVVPYDQLTQPVETDDVDVLSIPDINMLDKKHCAQEVIPMEKKEDYEAGIYIPEELICADNIESLMQKLANIVDEHPDVLLNIVMKAMQGDTLVQSPIVAMDFDGEWHTGSSLTWYAMNINACYHGATYYAQTMPSGWDDVVSSSLALGGCNSSWHYENTHFGGSQHKCTCSQMWALNNKSSSRIFAP